ncbi:uncharacterized protein C9orf40 homolog [Dermochelys coriacea]|uniref:uncharacterized protein C9orf40 homolog n=1 Tax=Dermochelys coriacea TaxID=27794 RepID=UPI001CA967EC|nr:uncharacterized protein C9orf40 homolog [Dermochelys coriacea]
MAKRHAEPLVCHVPWKRCLPEPPPLLRVPGRRLRDGPELRSPGKKRKLEETEAPPGKRPGLRGNRPGREPGDPASPGGRRRQQRGGDVGPRPEQAVRAGGLDPLGEERGPEEHEEEIWQYNSFQYWRAPLPAIDLSVLLDLDGENMTNARTTSRTEIIETEMET